MSVRIPRAATALVILALTGCKTSGAGSGLTIDPTSLAFSADRSGPLPPPQSIHVIVNDSNANYVIGGYPPGVTPPSWVSLSLTGAATTWNLQAAISSTALDPGTYSTTLRIAIARGDESVIAYRDVQVTYTVASVVTVLPSSLAFTQVIGSAAPAAQSVTVAGTN